MSPLLRSIDTRNSRAGPTAFLAAATRDSSTAAMRTSLEMPFSRSQNSITAKKSEFITASATAPSPRGEQKSRKNQFSDLHMLAFQQNFTSVGTIGAQAKSSQDSFRRNSGS